MSLRTLIHRRRTDPFATPLQAPVTSLHEQDTQTMPRPVAAQDIRFGEWDTPEERAEAPEIFGPDNRVGERIAIAGEPDETRNTAPATGRHSRSPMARPYAPQPLTDPADPALFRARLLADLGGCPLFREAMHAALVRAEPHHQVRDDAGSWVPCGYQDRGMAWQMRYATIYRHRTALPESLAALCAETGAA
jgi:hypothetical protein